MIANYSRAAKTCTATYYKADQTQLAAKKIRLPGRFFTDFKALQKVGALTQPAQPASAGTFHTFASKPTDAEKANNDAKAIGAMGDVAFNWTKTIIEQAPNIEELAGAQKLNSSVLKAAGETSLAAGLSGVALASGLADAGVFDKYPNVKNGIKHLSDAADLTNCTLTGLEIGEIILTDGIATPVVGLSTIINGVQCVKFLANTVIEEYDSRRSMRTATDDDATQLTNNINQIDTVLQNTNPDFASLVPLIQDSQKLATILDSTPGYGTQNTSDVDSLLVQVRNGLADPLESAESNLTTADANATDVNFLQSLFFKDFATGEQLYNSGHADQIPALVDSYVQAVDDYAASNGSDPVLTLQSVLSGDITAAEESGQADVMQQLANSYGQTVADESASTEEDDTSAAEETDQAAEDYSSVGDSSSEESSDFGNAPDDSSEEEDFPPDD